MVRTFDCYAAHKTHRTCALKYYATVCKLYKMNNDDVVRCMDIVQ